MIPTYKTWEEFQSICNVLYQRRINEHVVVQVVQLMDKDCECGRRRSQFLALVIRDKLNDKWISLKLSTARKIWKFVVKNGFDVARRLKSFEIEKLKRNDE